MPYGVRSIESGILSSSQAFDAYFIEQHDLCALNVASCQLQIRTRLSLENMYLSVSRASCQVPLVSIEHAEGAPVSCVKEDFKLLSQDSSFQKVVIYGEELSFHLTLLECFLACQYSPCVLLKGMYLTTTAHQTNNHRLSLSQKISDSLNVRFRRVNVLLTRLTFRMMPPGLLK